MEEKILVIDDDESLLDLIRLVLEREGYSVYTVTSGQEGLSFFRQVAPDLVVLDIMMPNMDGLEVCRCLRKTSAVPIIFLTALGEERDVVDGLLTGADDYLTKPVRASELRARVAALLRRARMLHEHARVLRFRDGELIINQAEQTVFAYGQEVSLSPVDYNLLTFMAEQAGRILSAQQILDVIWPGGQVGLQSIKWHIWHLRQQIEADPKHPRFILTERGKGYRFSPR